MKEDNKKDIKINFTDNEKEWGRPTQITEEEREQAREYLRTEKEVDKNGTQRNNRNKPKTLYF